MPNKKLHNKYVTDNAPRLNQLLDEYEAAITDAYKSGARDKKTVCEWISLIGAKSASRGYRKEFYKTLGSKKPIEQHERRPFYLELFPIGYAAACQKWDELIVFPDLFARYLANGLSHAAIANELTSLGFKKPEGTTYSPSEVADLIKLGGYDPEKGTLHSVLFAHVKWTLCKSAAESSHRMNIRKHEKGEVLPTMESYEVTVNEDGDVVTKGESFNDGHTKPADTSYWKFCPNTKLKIAGEPPEFAIDEKGQPIPPAEPKAYTGGERVDEWEDRRARQAAEVCLYAEIEKIPTAEERELLLSHWQVLGRRKETVPEMAKRLGRRIPAMQRHLDKLLEECQQRAVRDNPRTAALPKTLGLTAETVDGKFVRVVRQSTYEMDMPVFVNGAKIKKPKIRPTNSPDGAKDFQMPRHYAQAWSQWGNTPS